MEVSGRKVAKVHGVYVSYAPIAADQVFDSNDNYAAIAVVMCPKNSGDSLAPKHLSLVSVLLQFLRNIRANKFASKNIEMVVVSIQYVIIVDHSTLIVRTQRLVDINIIDVILSA